MLSVASPSLRALALMVASLGVLALWPAAASAQAPPPAIRVTTNAPVPLSVDGLEAGGLPALVPPGSQVCVSATLHYSSVTERWSFERWSHGPRTECVTLAQPGLYRALYAREVLFTTPSPIKALRKTVWVPFGPPYDVQVPPEVQDGERVRYRFQEWSGGEFPFLPANRIAVLGPTSLEAKWAKEYLVRVEGPEGVAVPGSGWYAEGASLVIQAEQTVLLAGGRERLKFARWESAGPPSATIANPEKPSAIVKVEGAHTIKAVYDREFLVLVTNPAGTLFRKWLKADEEIKAETPPTLETIPGQVQLLFRRWEGLEGVLSPTVQGIVQGPLELRAVYDRQVFVTVVTPYGPAAGNGWQRAGGAVTVSVPGSSQNKLVFRRVFQGFAGYASGRNAVQVLAQEPVTITALYRTEVNVSVLALVLLVPLAAVLTFLFGRLLLPARVRPGPRPRRASGSGGGTPPAGAERAERDA